MMGPSYVKIVPILPISPHGKITDRSHTPMPKKSGDFFETKKFGDFFEIKKPCVESRTVKPARGSTRIESPIRSIFTPLCVDMICFIYHHWRHELTGCIATKHDTDCLLGMRYFAFCSTLPSTDNDPWVARVVSHIRFIIVIYIFWINSQRLLSVILKKFCYLVSSYLSSCGFDIGCNTFCKIVTLDESLQPIFSWHIIFEPRSCSRFIEHSLH